MDQPAGYLEEDRERLEVWDVGDNYRKLVVDSDIPMCCQGSFSSDARHLAVSLDDGEPVLLNLSQEPFARRTLSRSYLKGASLDLQPLMAFESETNYLMLLSEDYLRVIDTSGPDIKEKPIWASSKARQALADDSDPVIQAFLASPNTTPDEQMLRPCFAPTLSKDGFFLITTHESGIRLWDLSGDILTSAQ